MTIKYFRTTYHTHRLHSLVISILCGLLLAGCSAWAGNNKYVLKVLVQEPRTKTAKPPLLLMLHGYGSNAADLFDLAKYLPDSFLIVSVQAPYKMDNDSYKWSDIGMKPGTRFANAEQVKASADKVLQLVQQLKADYAYNPARVFVSGFSQGGAMSLCLGLNHPDVFRGAVILSGRTIFDLMPATAPPKKFANFDLLLIHGTQDWILPINYGNETDSLLNKLSIRHEYYTYPIPHTINGDVVNTMNKWLRTGTGR